MTPAVLDRVLDVVVRVDADFNVKFVSDAGVHWLGYPCAEEVPPNFMGWLHPADVERFLVGAVGAPDLFSCDVRLLKNGKESWAHIRGYHLAGTKEQVLCILDISQWKTDEQALRHAAEHDALTGLPNRAFLKASVDRSIRVDGAVFSVVLMDLDGFKKVNDTYGHAIGDAVLVETTKRLLKCVGPRDILARLGGDEFVLLMHDKDAKAAKEALSSVLFAIARPFEVGLNQAYLGVSIGVAEFPSHGMDYSTLLKNADTAMYHSKSEGKNRTSIFLQSQECIDFSINAAIHYGIEEGEFYMEYQPQYDIHRNVIGAEALMRWTSRHFGRVAPDQFIHVAEDAGLMPYLGRWALRYACHQLKKFQALQPDFVMSINVSPIQFDGEDFDTVVLDAITEAEVDPHCVVLEITESMLMRSKSQTERALTHLRDCGVRFSIDDFGTGFSSLAYLTRLPVSSIKIDKAFVRAIENPKTATESDKKLIAAMINLAHSIGLKVVAEGVENESQFAFLKNEGCNLIQGYLLGRPMSADSIQVLLGVPDRRAA